jgi:hypothetical protein
MDKILKGLGKKWHSDDYGVSKEDVCMARNREAKAAADIIYRLTAERDEARRELCRWSCVYYEEHVDLTDAGAHCEFYLEEAERRGWDCFKDEKAYGWKEATDGEVAPE